MTWVEKLRILEEPWEAISREGDRYESPAWHQDTLNETRKRAESGSDEAIDWSTAKREFRK